MTYGQACITYLCNPTQGLTCSSGTGTDCSCPNTYGANICDCTTSQYWNGLQCVARVTFNAGCLHSYDCLYNTGLTCAAGVCACATVNTYWTGTQCRNLIFIINFNFIYLIDFNAYNFKF